VLPVKVGGMMEKVGSVGQPPSARSYLGRAKGSEVVVARHESSCIENGALREVSILKYKGQLTSTYNIKHYDALILVWPRAACRELTSTCILNGLVSSLHMAPE